VGSAFLGLPIVREWATLMRVDMLGVALGLWGMVALLAAARVLPAAPGPRRLLPAAILITLSLFVKPSLIAAPAAALFWLVWRSPRAACWFGALLAFIGGGLLLVLNLVSGGGFWLHVVTANANAWELALARGFWREQYAIHWPLWLAGALAALWLGFYARRQPAPALLLPISYTLFGAIGAFGVGKVGAYANYFLEFDAGLFWLVALAVAALLGPAAIPRRAVAARLGAGALLLLTAGALLRYYPLWSEEHLKPYGLIEGRRPARMAFGSYGIRADLARERAVLAALGRVNAALDAEVRAAGGPIVTDIPGIAAQSGALYRHQAFEHRQILDIGVWDQRPLLRELANGDAPLIVLDYLGNWLTPEMITLITSRYAQDGSRGAYDLYRPLASGSFRPLTLDLGGGVALQSAALAPPGGDSYSPGETVVLSLVLAATPPGCALAVTLVGPDGAPAAVAAAPLLYGALAPRDWGATPIQQMLPVAIPPGRAPGEYELQIALLSGGQPLAAPQAIERVTLGEASGRLLGEQGHFVPAPLLRAWAEAGGYDGPGDPIMPAAPFADGVRQCFVRACFTLRGGAVERVPLGEIIALGELTPQPAAVDAALADTYAALGGEAALGPPIGPAFQRGDRIIQYTRFARIERNADGAAWLAPLGVEYLRLPGGTPYRWP
jgi:hypothetical protein